MEIFISFILSLWIVFTLLAHSKTKIANIIRSKDILQLIPQWNYFAPHPETNCYHLLYRDKLSNKVINDFKEIKIWKRSPLRALWNPSRRNSKVLLDVVHSLAQTTQDKNIDTIKRTLPYLLIENYIRNCPHSSIAKSTQFAIFSTQAGELEKEEPTFILLSDFFPMKK